MLGCGRERLGMLSETTIRACPGGPWRDGRLSISRKDVLPWWRFTVAGQVTRVRRRPHARACRLPPETTPHDSVTRTIDHAARTDARAAVGRLLRGPAAGESATGRSPAQR